MKKFLVAVALSFALVGCNTGADEPVGSTEDTYVKTLQQRSSAFDNADEDQLVDAGKQVCTYFDNNGINHTSIITLMDEFVANFGLEVGTMLISESVEAFCPEKSSLINHALST